MLGSRSSKAKRNIESKNVPENVVTLRQLEFDDPHAIIHLNVGGTKYATSVTTLQSQPGTLLAEMFSGHSEPARDKDGSYFIDRDGEFFRYVLNFLRDGTLPSNASAAFRKSMKMEAAFYQIPQLMRWGQGSDVIGGTTTEAERVADAFQGAAFRHLSAVYGRSHSNLIEEITDYLVQCAADGLATASCQLFQKLESKGEVMVPWPKIGPRESLNPDSARLVRTAELPKPNCGLVPACEVLVARLEELGFPCLFEDGLLQVDIQHTRPADRCVYR